MRFPRWFVSTERPDRSRKASQDSSGVLVVKHVEKERPRRRPTPSSSQPSLPSAPKPKRWSTPKLTPKPKPLKRPWRKVLCPCCT